MERTHVIFDIITGEETIVILPETPEEKKAREDTEALVVEYAAKLAVKNAIAEKLGLTPDDLKALGL